MSDDLTDDELALQCAIEECDSSKLPADQKHGRNLTAGLDAVRLRAGERSLIG